MIGAFDSGFINDVNFSLAEIYNHVRYFCHSNFNLKIPELREVWGEDAEIVFSEGLPLPRMDRMKIEQKQLNQKISKIHAFINSDRFNKIEGEQQDLLIRQMDAMQIYYDLLSKRIISSIE